MDPWLFRVNAARGPLGGGLRILVAGLAAAAVVLPVRPADAAPTCSGQPPSQPTIAELPWAQQWFQPERAWPLSTGRGVTVAVIDSGVDARHVQLRDGRVRSGYDMIGKRPGGDGDCDGHGTAVASIIAARTVSGIGFAGLAPDAAVLPVRVADARVDQPTREVTADEMAAALRWAADSGAQVINVSIVFLSDHPAIRAAVEQVQSRGVLIVAAVGNHHDDSGTAPDATPYPAAYPGVLGVGAVGPEGTRLSESYVGPHVDLVAPGSGVTVAARVAGHSVVSGTSYATPFVSATAALLLAAGSGLSTDDVRRRLLAAADPPAGPPDEYGHGVLNPYRALTERVVTEAPDSAQPVLPEATDPRALAREQRRQDDALLAAVLAAGVAALAGLLALTGSVLRRGRSSRWRPRARTTPAEPPVLDDVQRRFYELPRAIR